MSDTAKKVAHLMNLLSDEQQQMVLEYVRKLRFGWDPDRVYMSTQDAIRIADEVNQRQREKQAEEQRNEWEAWLEQQYET